MESDTLPWRFHFAPVFPILLFFIAIALNPVGFIGGDADDLQYLEAARCWMENGPCLPHDHWQGRWPIIAPLALSISLLGESRWSVASPSLAASVACLWLIYHLGRKQLGEASALIATCLLAATPVFALQALDPNVDSLELAFILCGFALILKSSADRRIMWPALCGLCFGLGLQVRETTLAAAPAAIAAFVIANPIRVRSKAWIVACAGVALPFAIEAIVYIMQTGDPLWRRRLSTGHAQLATTELMGRSRVSGLPFFNRELIENWRHEPGIRLHWAIDGLANLIANPRTGGLFLVGPCLWLMCRSYLARRERQVIRFLALATIIHAAIIIYVFAIDPKPRMMLAPLAAVSLAIGPMVACLWRQRPAFTKSLLAILSLISAANILSGYRADKAEQVASSWIDRNSHLIETARQTHRRFIFIPGHELLAPISASRPLLMVQVNSGCATWRNEMGIDRNWLPLVRSASLGTYPANFVDRQAHLCLFRYAGSRADAALLRALGPSEINW